MIDRFELTVLDCLRGFEKAINIGWYNQRTFNAKDYEHYHKLENGDMNFIVPGKLLGFSSPIGSSHKHLGGLEPSKFIESFKKLNIKAIIRLNDSLYESQEFEREGIRVYDLQFPDGTCPNEDIMNRFLYICDN